MAQAAEALGLLQMHFGPNSPSRSPVADPCQRPAPSCDPRIEEPRRALARKWALIPLHGKVPVQKGWQRHPPAILARSIAGSSRAATSAFAPARSRGHRDRRRLAGRQRQRRAQPAEDRFGHHRQRQAALLLPGAGRHPHRQLREVPSRRHRRPRRRRTGCLRWIDPPGHQEAVHVGPRAVARRGGDRGVA